MWLLALRILSRTEKGTKQAYQLSWAVMGFSSALSIAIITKGRKQEFFRYSAQGGKMILSVWLVDISHNEPSHVLSSRVNTGVYTLSRKFCQLRPIAVNRWELTRLLFTEIRFTLGWCWVFLSIHITSCRKLIICCCTWGLCRILSTKDEQNRWHIKHLQTGLGLIYFSHIHLHNETISL